MAAGERCASSRDLTLWEIPMFTPPPIPSWDAMHPIIVHFPIALLLTSPVFVVAAIAWRSRRREMLLACVALMTLGTISAFLATASGEAGEVATRNVPGADIVLQKHEELAESARNLYLGLTVITAIVALVAWRRHEQITTSMAIAGGVLLLLLNFLAGMVLVNAAHQGGRLVHELGVRAPWRQPTIGGPGPRVPSPVISPRDALPTGARERE